MTATESRARLVVDVLADRDLPALLQLLDADPYGYAGVTGRIESARTLERTRIGATMFGVRRGSELVAACFSGGNLVPIGGEADAWELLARHAVDRPRVCSSIVGPRPAVAAMWPRLLPRWGPARAVRAEQPVLVCAARTPLPAAADVGVASIEQLPRFLAASAAMFAEELGVQPAGGRTGAAFRGYLRELIEKRRALVAVDFRGQVTFKAEIQALTTRTAQVQSVWVRPDLRGQGYGTAAMAAVLDYALELAPTVSLYVNDYNLAARRVYEKLGMQEVGTLSTVLL